MRARDVRGSSNGLYAPVFVLKCTSPVSHEDQGCERACTLNSPGVMLVAPLGSLGPLRAAVSIFSTIFTGEQGGQACWLDAERVPTALRAAA